MTDNNIDEARDWAQANRKAHRELLAQGWPRDWAAFAERWGNEYIGYYQSTTDYAAETVTEGFDIEVADFPGCHMDLEAVWESLKDSGYVGVDDW